jgi:hypothetical protein
MGVNPALAFVNVVDFRNAEDLKVTSATHRDILKFVAMQRKSLVVLPGHSRSARLNSGGSLLWPSILHPESHAN